MSAIFPPELTDRIIGCVDSVDKKTLRHCSLVCHQWLPASRCALFRRIDIADEPTLELLINGVLHSESARPYLALVREFNIFHRSRKPPRSRFEDRTPSPAPQARLLLYHLSGQIPGVEHISLETLTWRHDSITRSYEPLLLSRFSSLKSLKLANCEFPSFHFVRRLLVALPSLDDLTFISVHWKRPYLPSPPSTLIKVPTRPELKKLRVIPCELRPQHLQHLQLLAAKCFLCWLAHTRSPASLRTLEILGEVLDHTGYLRDEFFDFLEVVSPRLETLTIPLTRNLPLARLHELRELHIDTLEDYSWAVLRDRLQQVHSSIVRIHLATIVTAEYARNETGVFEDKEFEELDEVLMSFKHLQEVTLVVACGPFFEGKEEVVTNVQGRLPRTQKWEGVLKVIPKAPC